MQRAAAVAGLVQQLDQCPHSRFVQRVNLQQARGASDALQNTRPVSGQGQAAAQQMLGQQLPQGFNVTIPQALAFSFQPVVVQVGEQVGAIVFDGPAQAVGTGAQALEFGHVQPGRAGRVPLDILVVAQPPRRGFRQVWEQAAQLIKMAAHIGARLAIRQIGPKNKSQMLAGYRLAAVQQQVSPQGQAAFRQRQAQRLVSAQDLEFAKEIDGKLARHLA